MIVEAAALGLEEAELLPGDVRDEVVTAEREIERERDRERERIRIS